jgi:hypothetical protein
VPLASSNLLFKKLVSESPSIDKNPIQNPTMRGSPKNPPSKVPAAMLPIIPRIVLWLPSNGFLSKNVRFQSIGQLHLSSNKNVITGGAALTAKRRIMILIPIIIMMEFPYSGIFWKIISPPFASAFIIVFSVNFPLRISTARGFSIYF